MSARQNVRCSSLTALLALAASGCGAGDGPVVVRGVVLLDGQPVSGAMVSFLPAEQTGRPATGFTDGQGAFRLTTSRKGDGALPGDYRVVVTKLETKVPDGPRWTEYWDEETGKRKKPVQYYGMQLTSARKPPKSLLPAVYGEASQTPLECRVPADGRVKLELASTVSGSGRKNK